MVLALFLLTACDSQEREIDEKSDAAYEAGCDEGRLAGSLAGTDDGLACRKRAEVPVETAHKGMLEYCEAQSPTDEELELSCDCKPCEDWDSGYLDCWPEGYDQSYRIGWDAADCDQDTGI